LRHIRGYAAINNILVCGRVDLKRCYIRGKQEQYAFISLQVSSTKSSFIHCFKNNFCLP
jgi:hypothetical protein